MSDLEEDLHATADSIAVDAERLTAIEEEKQRLEADDPRMLELSVESQRVAARLMPKTSAELDLAGKAQSD